MKLTCDLCGGQLMVGSGGQTASCTVCGLLYSMERLREKLGIAPVQPIEPPVVTPPVKSTVKVKISKKPPVLPPPEIQEPWQSEPATLTEYPPIEEPIVVQPIVEEPIVVQPIVEEPIVVQPIVEEPVVEDPIVEEPVVEEPVVEEPVVEEPIVEEPIVEEPIVEEPIVEEPIVEEPIVVQPIVEEPIVEEPVVEDPVVEEPIVEDPIVEEPVVEEPIVEEPIMEDPIVEEPIAEDPIVEEPIAEDPIVEEPPVVQPPVPTGYFPPKPPVSYWIPPMEPPIAPLFAMELRGVSFSTIRGTVLSGTVMRGSQLLLGSSICSVISCKPAQLTPGCYAELTISNCPSRAALRNLTYVIGYSSEVGMLVGSAIDYEGSPKAYMTRILQAAFPDYQIQVTNAPTPKDPVIFTFHAYGRKRLVVILCHGRRYESEPVLECIEQCTQENIPYLRFFENFRNSREYIIGRIRKTLIG